MDRALELPALVLLDEVGGGTDPVEGGALGTAVIDHFRQRGAVVVATTHDDALKSYAATTDGVDDRGVRLQPGDVRADLRADLRRARPQPRARNRASGSACRAAVIADARTRRSGRESQLAAHLARVDRELAALEARDRQRRDERDGAGRRAPRRCSSAKRDSTEREAVLQNAHGRQAERTAARGARRGRSHRRATLKQQGRRAGASKPSDARGPSAGAVDRRSRRPARRGARGARRRRGRHRTDATEPPAEATGFDAPPAIGDDACSSRPLAPRASCAACRASDVDVEVRGKRMRVPLSRPAQDRRRDATASLREEPAGARGRGAKSGTASGGPAGAPTRETRARRIDRG